MNSRGYLLPANTVIRASAGTGKTFALVETVTHLLAGLTHIGEPIAPRALVAITFTEKAAGEMLERIRSRIEDRANDRPSTELLASAELLGVPVPTAQFWRGVRRDIDQLRVGTFHSFCLGLLQRFPLEAGLDPLFSVYDEEGPAARLEDLAELVTLAALEDPGCSPAVAELLERIDLRARFDFTEGVAAALPALLDAVHESGIEVAELPAQLAPGDGSEADLCERRLAEGVIALLERLEVRWIAEKRRRGQIDFADMQRLARNLLRDRPDVRRAVKGQIRVLLVDEFQDTNPIQRDLVLMLAEPADAEADWTARRPGEVVPPGYVLGERRLFAVGDPKQSIYDFRGADVSTFSEVEALVAAQGGFIDSLRVSYRTRPALVEAANALFAEVLDRQTGEDEPWFIHWTPEAALRPDRAERLGPSALHLIDTEAACRAAAEAGKRGRKIAIPQELGAVAELVRRMVEGPEPFSVVERSDGEDLVRPARWGDISVLLRRFSRVLPHLTEAFDRLGVPYYVVKGRGFFAAREVADLSIALRAVCAAADSLALVAWLRGPMVGLSDTALAVLRAQRRLDRRLLADVHRGRLSLDALSAADQRALARSAALHGELQRHGEGIGAARAIDMLIERTDWTAVLAGLPQGEQALANVRRARQLAEDYARRTGGGLAAFSRHLHRLVDQEPQAAPAQILEEGEDAVRIMTIHQSKGLECRIAVIPDADATTKAEHRALRFSRRHGIGVKIELPGETTEGGSAAPRHHACEGEARSRRLAEARRLFYVAVTRARDHVVLSGEAPLVKEGRRGYVLAQRAANRADWMHVVYGFKQAGPPWLRLIDIESLGAPAPRPRRPAPHLPADVLETAIARIRRPQPVLGGDLVAAVTQLGDFAVCPRRFWYFWEMGLLAHGAWRRASDDEALPAAERALEAEASWPVDPLDRGTLAHHLLEYVDLADYMRLRIERRRGLLLDLASSAGAEVAGRDRDDVVAAVARLLDGPFGQRLAAERALERERAFLLHLPLEPAGVRGSLLLRGQIDAVFPGDLLTEPCIVDYKYAEPRPNSAIGDGYAFQLRCYALALHRRQGSPKHGRYQAGLVFLRASNPALTPLGTGLSAADLEAFAVELAQRAAQLIQARQTGVWPLLDHGARPATCPRCPFQHHCFPPAASL